MNVTVEYTGVLDIKTVPSGGVLELPPGATVSALLERLGIDPAHRKYITPLVNNAKAKNSTTLVEGDRIYLLLPVGGG
ncbi:MAG TPA: MoaD/ThiS family protein [Kiritimatiellia bacterium]|nr:MoaD/ThiS family protein [Kiritimatiellia bacterium]HRZ13379.1 MoaD/ThiS family protein [Kiritimatiellia bacterium]HSA18981.1 MoaD/ThiS family protein [Kiritimatiellia bacterium]